MYEVHPSSARYWCTRYGLHVPTRKERQLLEAISISSLREQEGTPLILGHDPYAIRTTGDFNVQLDHEVVASRVEGE